MTSQISDESTLRARARELIQAGKLPNRRPERTWGGQGEGAYCTICSAPVKRDEVEFEIEFARDGNDPGMDTYHAHVRCLAAWEIECRNLELAKPISAGDLTRSAPDITLNRRALPEQIYDGNIAGHGCDPTHNRGPA